MLELHEDGAFEVLSKKAWTNQLHITTRNTRVGRMEEKASLLERLESKLSEICKDDNFVAGILHLLEADEERQLLLDIAEAGGEEATPRNLVYAAINIDDERS